MRVWDQMLDSYPDIVMRLLQGYAVNVNTGGHIEGHVQGVAEMANRWNDEIRGHVVLHRIVYDGPGRWVWPHGIVQLYIAETNREFSNLLHQYVP